MNHKIQSIKSIAKKLFPLCFIVDKDIVKLPYKTAKFWAESNSIRHALTVKEILSYAQKNNKKQLNILNASGINCGHQDFCIVDYLNKYTNLGVCWTVFDSANNKYLGGKEFKEMINSLNIDLKLTDFKNEDDLYGDKNEIYDVIIFTEIAEHLEHSTLLRCLKSIRAKLKNDGIIILTTPNLLSLANRIRFIFGDGDSSYYGDGNLNLAAGLYGHIVLYDIKRLKRLLADCGLHPLSAYTFNDNYGCEKRHICKRFLIGLLEFSTNFIKNSKRRIIIIAKKSEPRHIVFKT